MNKATFFVGIIISVIVVSGIRLVMNQDDTPSQPSQSSQTEQQTNTDTTVITKTGVFNCLAKSGDGPQTMECVQGLTSEDGTQYALSSEDSALFAGVATGTRIEVTGSLKESVDTVYDTAGTINVQSFVQL